MNEKIKLVYVTASSVDEADKLATLLVKENLIACANILGASSSIYRWEGQLMKENEIVSIFKTSSKSIKKLLARINELHSYECPSVVVLNVDDGNKNFLDWIENSTNLGQ